ncbi:MAG: hypothetical protein LAO21_01490 [Acidobacteriia bacterium]|nr:hypothetical protein [Terriglobia bacterium]
MSQIVYFVGAGLTKSLQQNSPVPLLNDFISVMADYLTESDVIRVALADFECDDLFEWRCDEWKDTAQSILDCDGSVPKDLLRKFQGIMKSRPSENIEMLLGRGFEKHATPYNSSAMRFCFAINDVFSRIGWNVNLPPLEQFLRKQLKLSGGRHTFISFNYDLVLDRCIREYTKGDWQPSDGYGFKIERSFNQNEGEVHMKQFDGDGGSFSSFPLRDLVLRSSPKCPVKLLKPHGSLNWLISYNWKGLTRKLFIAGAGCTRWVAWGKQRLLFSHVLLPPTKGRNGKISAIPI